MNRDNSSNPMTDEEIAAHKRRGHMSAMHFEACEICNPEICNLRERLFFATLPKISLGRLWTLRCYPCGCTAEGPDDVPNYCSTHEPDKRAGVETAAERAPTPMMHIYAHPGTKVVFAYPGNGYDGDRAHAAKHLTVGETYTVKRTSVGGSSSSVYLSEFPDTCFNTVQFAPAEQVKSTPEPTTCGPGTPWDRLCGEPSCSFCGARGMPLCPTCGTQLAFEGDSCGLCGVAR